MPFVCSPVHRFVGSSNTHLFVTRRLLTLPYLKRGEGKSYPQLPMCLPYFNWGRGQKLPTSSSCFIYLLYPILTRGGQKLPTSSPRVVYLLYPILAEGGEVTYLFPVRQLLTLPYLNQEEGKSYPPLPHASFTYFALS